MQTYHQISQKSFEYVLEVVNISFPTFYYVQLVYILLKGDFLSNFQQSGNADWVLHTCTCTPLVFEYPFYAQGYQYSNVQNDTFFYLKKCHQTRVSFCYNCAIYDEVIKFHTLKEKKLCLHQLTEYRLDSVNYIFSWYFFFSLKVLDGQCLFQTTSDDRKRNYPYSNQMKSENYRQTCGFF